MRRPPSPSASLSPRKSLWKPTLRFYRSFRRQPRGSWPDKHRSSLSPPSPVLDPALTNYALITIHVRLRIAMSRVFNACPLTNEGPSRWKFLCFHKTHRVLTLRLPKRSPQWSVIVGRCYRLNCMENPNCFRPAICPLAGVKGGNCGCDLQTNKACPQSGCKSLITIAAILSLFVAWILRRIIKFEILKNLNEKFSSFLANAWMKGDKTSAMNLLRLEIKAGSERKPFREIWRVNFKSMKYTFDTPKTVPPESQRSYLGDIRR